MKNKLSKLLALVVALATLMALTIGTASAAEPTIIDYTKRGSITVHKYSENTFQDAINYQTQTEMENYMAYLQNSGNKVTPLADVTFRYLKVGDILQYTKNVVGNDGKTVNVVKIGYSLEPNLVTLLNLSDNDIDYTDKTTGTNYYSVSTLDAKLNKVSATKVEKYINGQADHKDMAPTNQNGTAEATDLDLGLYLLVEYSYLADTVANEEHAHSVPCFIPLPLTDHQTDGTYYWDYDVNVYPKNIVEDVTIDQVIVGNDLNETKEWDTEINSTVKYLIRSDIPHAIGKLQTYTINDKLSTGLDYDKGSYSVYALDYSGKRTELLDGRDFNFSNTDSHNMTWAFVPTALADNEGWAKYESIEIRYTVTPNKLATVGANGNDNYCELLYSHTSNTDTSAAAQKTLDKKVPTMPYVFTYAMDLTKYGDSDNERPLANVTYELQDYDGQVIHVSEQDTGVVGAYYFDPNGTATLTTDANGKLYLKGFEAGTYYLKETTTNNGYSLLADKVKIVIESNENSYTEDANGTYVSVDNTAKYYTDETFTDTTSAAGATGTVIEGTDTAIDSYKWFFLPTPRAGSTDVVPSKTYVHFNTSYVKRLDNEAVTLYTQNKLTWNSNFTMGTDRNVADTGVLAVTINDQKIFELPHTGGVGKYCIIGAGFAALAAAAAYLTIECKKTKAQ